MISRRTAELCHFVEVELFGDFAEPVVQFLVDAFHVVNGLILVSHFFCQSIGQFFELHYLQFELFGGSG